MKVVKHSFWYLVVLGITVWIIGFGAFCLYAVSFRFRSAEATDAIVVLTGGNERVQTALNLLKEKYADHLLISGVNKAVQLSDLTGTLSEDMVKNVQLGYRAKDTQGNAMEIAEWVSQNDIHSVLMVTSFYHMPRSLFEVLHYQPDLKIVALPVFPKSFGDSVDWIRTRYAWLLFVEYHKFIFAHLRYLVKG